MDFNYTEKASVLEVGEIKRDYRYQEVAFWNDYLPALVNYMTTTFPPWEVRERREAVAFQATTGILALVLAVVIVIAVFFGYKYANRRKEIEVEVISTRPGSRADSRRQFVRLNDYPSTNNIQEQVPPLKISSL